MPALLGVVLACAVAVRLLAAIVLPDQGSLLPDAAAYRDAAVQLAGSGRIGSLYIMPLYPALIAIVGAGSGQLAADILLSTLSVWLVHALALELFHDNATALLAAIAAAFYPPLVFFALVGLSETLFIALVLGAFLCWYKGQFIGAAALAVLAILTRPVFDLAALLLVVWFAIVIHRMSGAATARQLAVYVAIYCALMAPWWLHNVNAYGSFVRLTPGFGTVLFAGNNPSNVSGGGIVGEDYDTTPFNAIADPVARDRALRDAALRHIAENPVRFVELAALKFARMWRPWPRHEGYSGTLPVVLSLVSFVPVAGLSLIYLAFWSRRDLVRISPILLLIFYFTAVHMVLVGTIRYRLPLEPFLIIFASAAALRLVRLRPAREGIVES